MANFELFLGCLGNGTTICNKAVMEYNDYKTIGHISAAGNIKLYVDRGYIPPEDLKRINRVAADSRRRFIEALEKDIEMRPGYAYEKMLNIVSTEEFIEHARKGLKGLSANIADLKPIYLERC